MRYVVLSVLVISQAFAVPSSNDMSQCLKTSVSKMDKNAIKTASKDLTKKIESSYKDIGASYYQEAVRLAKAVNQITEGEYGDFNGIREQFTQTFENYKNSLEILKGTEGLKAALEKRVAEINSLATTRLDSLKNSVDPKRIAKSVSGTLKGQYEGLMTKAGSLEDKFDSMGATVEELKKFNPNTSLEDRKKTEADLKSQTEDMIQDSQEVITSGQQIGSVLSSSKSLSDSLSNVSSVSQAQNLINQANVPPETKAAHQEALSKVSGGQQTLSQFKQDSAKNSQELAAEIQKNQSAISDAQSVLAKAENFQVLLNGGFSSSLETAKAATDFLQSVRPEQGRLGSYVESGLGLVGKYQEIGQSGNPVALITSFQNELLSERGVLLGEISQINNALPGLQQNFQGAQNLFQQGLPGYVQGFQSFMNVQGQLAQARSALEEARSILEFGEGSEAVLMATNVAFEQLQPVIECVHPWMKYITMAALLTRGQLNFFDIFKGIAAKSNIPNCKKGVYIKKLGR